MLALWDLRVAGRVIFASLHQRPSAFCLDRAEIPKFLAWAESSMSI